MHTPRSVGRLKAWLENSERVNTHSADNEQRARPSPVPSVGGSIRLQEVIRMDMDDFPAPKEGFVLTHFLTVRDYEKARVL